jgi:hypothetical protein
LHKSKVFSRYKNEEGVGERRKSGIKENGGEESGGKAGDWRGK